MSPWAAPKACQQCGRTRCDCRRTGQRRRDQQRPKTAARGYGGKWQTESKRYLEVNQACRMCGDPSQVVDHIEPHRGDQRLFWRRSNWQPLCKRCHDTKTGKGA